MDLSQYMVAFDVRAIADIMKLYAKLKVPFDLISIHDVYSLNDFGISDYPKFAGWSLNFHHVPVANLQLEVPIYKVAIANQPKIINHLARQIHSDLFRVTRSRRELLELMPSGVSKATGIIAASQFYDLPLANVIAFGDEENDLEMLKTAGIGVAMGNAVQAVRQAVTRHTLTNDQDGLTEFLEAYFK
ncbi:HAD-IIB family hydrolase [Lactobacillus sp. CC-MHH1034]|uniref:HAD-IIB family hydrolase n=1 Tax=Agrilactobacillus fermenti TaxID=2586909 RepID=UPI001E30F88E|nr:HAD-IIB family hydrolase [Agrilactobacillus fermenti]MCD2256355.1 HAD-IIB family hydrolase [Agrilactobacillus fermenti]